ncbi:MAG: PKD domain-containing protein [Bacteroidales bacterium]|nr:PKD domain-containing protein [Bacteroidales bacterium]
MKRIILLVAIAFVCSISNIKAQVGTDFWFAPPNVTEYHNPPNFPIYLLITTLDNPATVTVSMPANGSFTPLVYNLPANSSQRVDLTSVRSQLETRPTNTVINTGLRIQATDKITVYYEVSNTNNNEIFALKGENGLGTEFYIPMHKDPNFYNHRFTNTPVDYAIASFDIIATEDNTNVIIYSPVLVDGHPANTQFSITLNKGQTYSCATTALTPAQSAPMNDYYQNPINHPAGASVISDKPIAITYKDDSDHDVPAGGCYDLIGDQIIPIDIAGTDYIAVKGGLANNGRESVILTGTQNNTKVYLNGSTTPIATIFAGETYQIIIDSLNTSSNNSIYIHCSKPVIATHITGFGCELGSAILPSLNCAGSSKVSFVRSSNETFILTFLVKTSAIDAFTFSPATASLTPADFKIVPGTNGEWSAAKKTFTTAEIPINTAYSISNSESLFAMGLINGGATTGCRYGYFSEFVAKIFVDAGSNQTICANQTASLSGSVTGGATAGIWSTSGTGVFIPNANDLNATYVPSGLDILNGSVKLYLTSNSDCYPVKDSLTLTITPAPTANAGPDQSVCANNPNVNLSGSISIATGGIWSGGSGTFSPSNTSLNATYTPTPAEIASGSITLTLTTTGNGSCDPATDQIVINFTPAPTANAGPDVTVCANNATVNLSGAVTVATGGTWSGGTGSFNPGPNALNTQYTPSPAELSSGTVNLTLTTTGNGGCLAVSDQMIIHITPAPTANAGTDQTKCKNNAVTTLAGSVTVATGGTWSGGTGVFNPNNNTLTATYTPSAAEIANGFVNLTLTTTGNGSCNAVSDNVVITFTDAPTVNAGTDVTVCANNATVSLNGTVTGCSGGQWSGGTGTFTPNNTTLNATYTPSAAEIAAGTVTLTLTTTGNGLCNPETDQMTITITPAPTVNAGSDITVCANNPTVTLNGVVTVATGGTWSGGSGSFNPGANALATQYTPSAAEIASGSLTLTLTTTGNGNCNAVSDNINITFTPAPTANAGTDQTKCKNNAVTTLAGSVTVATGGTWSGGTGVFNPNNNTLTATYTPSAAEIANGFVNLTLTTTGNGSCNAVSDNVVITFTDAPTVNAGTDVTVCANNATVSLNGTVTGCSGGQWSGGTGTFTPNNTTLNATYTPSAAEIAAGTVTLTLTTTGNGLCNPETDQMTITITPAPTVNAGSDITVCKNNANVTLFGSVQNAGGGIWSGGLGSYSPSNSALNTIYSPSPSEISSGSMTLTLTSTGNGNCLAVSDQVQITFTEAPIANAGSDQVKCANNASITLNGSVIGASGGQWSGGLGIYSPNANTLNAVYTPTAQEIANGVTLTLTTTGNGTCNAVSDQMSVVFTPAPTADAGPNVSVCANNANVNLNGSVTVASGGTWSGGLGTFSPSANQLSTTYIPSASEIAAGQVTLTLTTTGNGTCNAVSDQILVNITPAPVVNAGSNQSACFNNPTVTLAGTVQNAGGGVWSGGSGVFNPSNTTLNATYTPTAAELAAGVVNLTLTSTSNGNCFAVSNNMQINITPAPIVNAGPDQIKCANNPNVSLNGTVSGASGGQWTGGLGQFIPNNNSLNCVYIPTAGEIASGSITLTLTSTGNGTCLPVSDNMVVTFTAAPTVNAGIDQVVCANNPAITLDGSYTVSTGAIWSGGAGTFSPNNTNMNAVYTPTAAEIAAGQVTLTLTTTGNGNCISESDQVTIFITPAPQVNAGSDITACANNANATLNGNILNAGGGIWSGGSGVFNPSANTLNATYTPTAVEIANGYVDLTLTSTGNGSCLAVSDVVRIFYTPAPVVNAGPDQTVCSNNNLVTLNGTVQNAGGGTWSNGLGLFSPNNNILTATYTPTQGELNNGQVMLILTSTGNGTCLAVSDTMVINYTPAPTANAGSDITICYNNPVVNLNGTVSVASGGLWSGGSGSFVSNANSLTTTYIPTTNELDDSTFTLTLTTTGNGTCNAVSDQLTVNVIAAPIVDAGQNQTVCVDNLTVPLNGYVAGPTNTGIWTTSGTGTFTPSPTSLNTNYIASSQDSIAGQVTLYLTSTSNGICSPVKDSMQISILPAGIANAGNDITVCANNAIINLNGQVSGGASSGTWSTTGSGVFLPNANTLNATYIPSNGDTATGSIMLILTANSCNVAKDTIHVTITDAPYVNAGSDKTVCVDNLDIQLNGTIYGASNTGFWTSSGTGYFTPSNTALNAVYHASSQDSINLHVTLVLTATNIGNCNLVTDTMQINILPPGIVNAGVDQILCANNGNVQLNGSVTGGASQGMWQTSGSGTFSPNNTTLNATYIPSQADLATGSVTLVLTATDACNFAYDVLQVNFTPAPTANAGTDQTVCANNSLVQLNGSYTIATGAQWTSSGSGSFIPDNTSMNAQYLPSAADIANGNVNVFLTTTGNGSCLAAKDTMKITITPAPIVNAGVDQFVCITGSNTNIYGLISGGASQGIWTTLGDGGFDNPTSLSTLYNFGNADTTNGSVQLVLTSTDNGNCLAVSDTMTIHFTNSAFVFAGPDKEICVTNPSVVLQAFITGGSSTGVWTTTGSGTFFPNTTSLNNIYTISSADSLNGSVDLILTSTNNGTCMPGRDTVHITIHQLPLANAGSDIFVCSGTTQIPINGSVTNASGGIWTTSGSGTFNPNDTTLSLIYEPSATDQLNGTVNIILQTTGNSICPADFDTTVIHLLIPITPNFSYTTPCLNANVQFTDQSIVSNGTITNWLWTFDGSQTDLNQNPTFSFNTTGTHTVQLTVTSSLGCDYSTQQQIYVNPLPNVNFSSSINCYLDEVQFTDESSVQGGQINNWHWNFGDTTVTSNLQNPTHLYQSFGTYNVVLTATSDSGCTASITKPVEVYPKPIAGFTYNDNCSNFTVTFTDTSSANPLFTINNWLWNFGDGNTSINQNPSHIYNTPGQYNVQLIVGVSANCKDTIEQTINTSNITANFGFTQLCNNNHIAFADSSIALGATINNWTWNFGDGNTSTSQNPNYLYADTGTYQVSLIVQTPFCSDTISKNITMQHLNGNLSYTYNCQNLTTTFTDQSTYAGNAPNNWTWNFGDGNFSNLQNPVHTYNDTGTYQVQLILSTSGICSDTINTNVTIYNVYADFNVNNTCLYDSVRFIDQTQFAYGNISQWVWNFGDGNSANVQNPSHLYNNASTYTVSLSIQTAQGCRDTISKQVTVYNVPQASFNIVTTDLQVNNPIKFVDGSTGANSWKWDFGDNFGTSTNQDPTYTYMYPGNYIVSEVVSNEFGCKDTAIQTITIIKMDEVYAPVLPSAFTPNGDNNNDTLYVRGGPFKEILFRVFNEWGVMIFESTDPNVGWDGKYKGDPQPIGVYVCTVKAITVNNKEYNFSVEVTLIR